MSESLPQPRDAARPHLRRFITTVPMIMISGMIVRDIFVRRWNSVTPAASDVTERSR
jgi:hypothetical protein